MQLTHRIFSANIKSAFKFYTFKELLSRPKMNEGKEEPINQSEAVKSFLDRLSMQDRALS
jgi:hypothetical protein